MAGHISFHENYQTKPKRCLFAPPGMRSTAFFVFLCVAGLQFANATELFARDVAAGSSIKPTDASTIILTASLVSLFLMLVSTIVLSLDAPPGLRHSARFTLCGFHLFAALLIGLNGPDTLSFLFPLMFALTSESMSLACYSFTRSHNRSLPAAGERNGDAETLGDFDRETEIRLIHAASTTDETEHVLDESEEEVELSGEEGLPEDCLLSLQRFQSEDSEVVSGQARAEFVDLSRTTAIHIAFCPPFEQTPKADVFQTGGADASVKTGMLERFGMRVDIKRPDNRLSEVANSDNSTIEIAFVVQAARRFAKNRVA